MTESPASSPSVQNPSAPSLSGAERSHSERAATALSGEEVEHFVRRGFVRVRGCFDRELASAWNRGACERLYCNLDDPETWPRGRMRPPESQRVDAASIAPKAWAAACQLIGGEERALLPCTWGDGLIINFGRQTDCAWAPPSPEVQPWQLWHKDGDFFRHFLDSPEQGLLVIAVFSDIATRGGGTYLACDSVAHVARYLADHPEGVLPLGFPADEIVSRCVDFEEVTGEVGDVLLMHPFMLHTRSVNETNQPRFIINPPVKLRAPMCFDRADPGDHSAVERAVLRALGCDSYAFRPTRAREAIVPERLAREKREWAERARLAGASSD